MPIGVAYPIEIPPATGTAVAVIKPPPFRVGLQLQVTVKGEVAGVGFETHPAIRMPPYLKVIFEA
jgi:hypothetical protein